VEEEDAGLRCWCMGEEVIVDMADSARRRPARSDSVVNWSRASKVTW
jgi:hypothetical protein